jgi:hypothetical protein
VTPQLSVQRDHERALLLTLGTAARRVTGCTQRRRGLVAIETHAHARKRNPGASAPLEARDMGSPVAAKYRAKAFELLDKRGTSVGAEKSSM